MNKKNYIGLNIKHLCNVKKLSQKDFGDIFGLTQSVINIYIKGKSNPQINTLIQICNYFNLSLDEFVRKPLDPNTPIITNPLAVEEPTSEYGKPNTYESLLLERERTIGAMEETLSIYRKMFEAPKKERE